MDDPPRIRRLAGPIESATARGAGPRRLRRAGPAAGAPGSILWLRLDDARKPLRSKLLAVPDLRQKYLQRVYQIAESSLDWKTLGPVVAGYRQLIEEEVKADTRKLATLEAFQLATVDKADGERHQGLRAFVETRREYLLDYQP